MLARGLPPPTKKKTLVSLCARKFIFLPMKAIAIPYPFESFEQNLILQPCSIVSEENMKSPYFVPLVYCSFNMEGARKTIKMEMKK